MELQDITLKEAEVRVREPSEDRRGLELYPEPDLDIPILPEDSEGIAEREEYTRESIWRSNMKTRSGGCSGRNVRGSPGMECSPRSDDGS